MKGQWDELLCQYFKSIVLKVLVPYFKKFGFNPKLGENDTGVTFLTNDGLFVELSYDPESSPLYSPSVIIGMGGRKFNNKGEPQSVPMWFVIPDGTVERQYSSWRFSSEKQLETNLKKIQTEILDKYSMPLLGDKDLLIERIKLFKKI